MADYKKMKGSKVSFTLTIEEESLKKAHQAVIQDFKQHVEVKGFRKGHAPDDKVVQQVGLHVVAREAFNHSVDKEYREFIIKNDLRPVSAPEIQSPDKPAKEGEPMKLKGEVEIFPEVTISGYEKVKAEKIDTKIEEKEIDKTIGDVLNQFDQSTEVKRAAKDGDVLIVDFRGKDKKGETLDRTDGKDMKIQLGAGQFLPDLEKAYIGMKAGDTKEDVQVAFPKDYPSPDFAGKKIPFDIAVHAVKEIKTTGLTAEQLKTITGKDTTEEDFRKDVEGMIKQQKEQQAFGVSVDAYQEKLSGVVKVDLPQSWIDREVEMRLQQAQQSPQWEEMKKNEEKMKKEFGTMAEKNLKVFLGLSEIVKQENVELDKDEKKLAESLVAQKLEKNKNADQKAEQEREELNMKIDKYLRGLIIG